MLGGFRIPLPPLEVQHQFISKVEGYERVINDPNEVIGASGKKIRDTIHSAWH